MFERIVLLLLDAKVHVIAAAKIPAIAALLVLGTTGFVVSGTIEAGSVDLTVRPLESKTCVDALIGQTEALLQLDALASDGNAELRHLRDRARRLADEQEKVLDETALRAQFDASAARLHDELAAARQQVLAAADLTKCQDGDANTGVSLDVADLRATYDRLVRDFGKKRNAILDEAAKAFDELVKNAPAKQPKPASGGGSNSRG